MLNNFNEFRDLCHSTSVACGWWDKAERKMTAVERNVIADIDPDRLTIPTKLALVHTEIREAHDFYLSGENDDHLPHLPGAPVELGDTIIRVGDTAGYLQIDMDRWIAEVSGEFRIRLVNIIIWQHPDETESYPLIGANAVLQLHNFTADATEAFRRGKTDEFNRSLARIVVLCDLICQRNHWDLIAISREKSHYNSIREDHKRQVREAEGGKII